MPREKADFDPFPGEISIWLNHEQNHRKLRAIELSITTSTVDENVPKPVTRWLKAVQEERQLECWTTAIDVVRAFKCLERYQAWESIKIILNNKNPEYDEETHQFFLDEPTCKAIREQSPRSNRYSLALSFITVQLRPDVPVFEDDGRISLRFTWLPTPQPALPQHTRVWPLFECGKSHLAEMMAIEKKLRAAVDTIDTLLADLPAAAAAAPAQSFVAALVRARAAARFLLFSDCEGALRALKILRRGCLLPLSYPPSLLENICALAARLDVRGVRVELRWVPSHRGITGNELADAVAKENRPDVLDPAGYL
ncbi:hypothetical protein UCDDS831_g01290 [Diplodia seriata]|uniref:Uncharacterized protein n=1 Tax=Diplodia seriata TaxID=420778 RepID=A0A0G2HDM5_9PEZI|nr:hypothetical protein UCDDS831_g01290 [Diplodia seriata]